METNSAIKILMVDDRTENLFALEIIFREENYQCIKATSGGQALEILEKEQDFAIILMDVQMPTMDGFETVELIRQIENLKHVPIIFLTASMDSSIQIFQGYQAGAVDYMIKPLSPEILRAKVAIFVDLYKKNKELFAQSEQLKRLNADFTAQKLLSKYSLSLIEANLDPLFAINQEGKITDMNSASIKVTGISREKLIGTKFKNYFTEPNKAVETYQNVFEKEIVADSLLRLRHKDGKLTDVLFNGSVYKDDEGNILGIVLVARDVTAQKRFENELIEAKSIAEGERQIAVAAVKSKQQFLSNMSHEIRTPMNAIIGFTKVVLKTELNKEQQEYLNAIKVSGDILIVLINDILDLAKVDSGKMTFERTPFKMEESITSMLHLFETKIQEKNLKLVREYDNKIPEVLVGDPVRLHQIILNLVSNAVKFTHTGKITVSVNLLHDDDDSATIEFAVTDTGIGIEAEELENIFENFQQATTDTSRIYGGTGLGLAIVKQLVEPQGGRISVKSEVNSGSVFSFILSFHKTKAEAVSETDLLELDSANKNIKVLVVEDIPLNQLLMETLLDDFGFECDIAANGKIATEILETDTYDIILMDLQMPEMNGFEATEYIRKTMLLKTPIIALTADVTTVDLAKCKSIGMNDYITKPIDEKLLYSKIVSLVTQPMILSETADKNDSVEKPKCTDLTYLIQRTKANQKLLMEMIGLYLEQTPTLINAMKQGVADKNWNKVQAAAHKMIPSFSIVGMGKEYEEMAKKVQEFASSNQQINEIPHLVLALENICFQACEELEHELDTIENSN